MYPGKPELNLQGAHKAAGTVRRQYLCGRGNVRMTWFKEVVFMLLIRIRGGTRKKNPETKSLLPGKAKKRIEFWIGINCIHCNTKYL